MKPAAIVHPKLAEASFERAIRPLLEKPDVFKSIGVALRGYAFPFLDVGLFWKRPNLQMGLRVDGSNYSYRPIHGWWIDDQGNPLVHPCSPRLPQGHGFQPQGRPDGQPGPWLCFAGWRDYHDHSSHQDRSWAFLRGKKEFSVLSVIQQLHSELNREGVTPA